MKPQATAGAKRALFALFVIVALVGRMIYVIKPFDHDARMFIYLGKMVCDGGRFGVDVVDNKFPTVGLMTSIFWRAFETNWPAYVLMQAVMICGAAILLARAVARTFGETSRLPTLLFALAYFNFNVAVFGGFQLESLQMFFSILAAYAAMEALRDGDWRDAFVVGLAAGCAGMLKPTGLSIGAAFACATLLRSAHHPRRLASHALATLGGLAIPCAATFAYLVTSDTLREMPAIYAQIKRYAAETPLVASDFLKPLIVLVMVGFPILVRAVVFRRDAVEKEHGPGVHATFVFLTVWLILELLGAVMQRRMYAYHFLPVAAPAAALFGMWPRRDRITGLTAALLPILLLSILGAREVFEECWPPKWRLQVSEYVAAHTTSDDSVWMDSMPRLLLETGCKPGSRIPLAFLFFNYDQAPLDYSEIMLKDFESRKPKFIVLPQNIEAKVAFESARAPEMARRPVRAENYRLAWQRIEAYVNERYLPEAQMEAQIIYRRQGDATQFKTPPESASVGE